MSHKALIRCAVLFFLFISISDNPLANTYIESSEDNQNISITQENNNQSGNVIHHVLILDSLYKANRKENPEKSLSYAKDMYNESSTINNNELIQSALLNIADVYYDLREFDSAYQYVVASIKLSKTSKNINTTARSYYLLSDVNYYHGEHIEGIENAMKAIQLYSQIEDSVKIARLYKELAILYREIGKFEIAIDYAKQSLDFFLRNNDSLHISDALRTIASLYPDTVNQKQRLKRLFLARQYLTNYRNSDINRIVLKSISVIYSRLKQFDSAYIIQKEMLNYVVQSGDKVRIANTYLSMGNTLMRMDSVNKAIQSFRKAKMIYIELNLPKYNAHIDYSLGEVYYAIYEYDSSIYYLNKSLILSKKIKYSAIYKASLNILTKVYEETKDYKNAYYYYKLEIQHTDSINNEKLQFKIAELETKFETSQKEQQILELQHLNEIEESEKEIQKVIFIVTIIVLVLIITLVIQQRKKDQLISRQKELFHQKENQLAKSELEKSKIKENELQQSILYKSKQLSTHALHMMQKNSMLQEIQADIKNLSKKADTVDKPYYKRINLQINHSLRSDKDWDVFKLYFEDVNRNFYNKLNEINPNLTTNDHRLCALIKLNMNSKEMASVLNVAPNSIKSSRYRLKKKLCLDIEADLEEFIRNIG